jgi:hypothetical protein
MEEQRSKRGEIIPSGLSLFDSVFGIRRGTLNLLYTQNQTWRDGTQIAMHWAMNNLEKDEAVLFFSTFTDPVSSLKYHQSYSPQLFKKLKAVSAEKKFFWIDNFSYSGFIEEDTRRIDINYSEELKKIGINLEVITVKRPQAADSVEGPFIALRDIFDQMKAKMKLRIFLGRVDDLIDSLGEKKAVPFYKYLGSHIHKNGHTGIVLMESMSQTSLIHRIIERYSNQIINLGFNDRGEKTPVKYFQAIKRFAAASESSYRQHPYEIIKLFPKIPSELINNH